MKNKFYCFLFACYCSLCVMNPASAQVPLVKQWDYRYGGDTYDYLLYFDETRDGGFIMGGMTSADSIYDKTVPSFGSIDYWIVKTDVNGIKLWDKAYGGSAADFLFCGEKTSDGGFIFGGYSESGISGTKTQPNVGDYDYWIVKTDSLGNVMWDKTFGGTGEDKMTSIKQTADGGYILGGYSASMAGGDKTQNSWGETDYWMVKTDSLGNKLWDKDFGGSLFETRGVVKQTDDHGYIVIGYSDSPISGDKTQAGWGGTDYWLVKTDSAGNLQWDKDLGGSGNDNLYSIHLLSGGGFLLGGLSESGVSGDKTQPTWNNSFDFWILKTDANGNIIWDKDFGGSAIEDEFTSIFPTQDKGFLLAGNSYSPVSGDKSENNLGIEQSWVLKIDSFGTKQWDKTPQTSGHDEISFMIETSEGCIVIANSTYGDIAGDKTQDNWGAGSNADYWIIKYCDSVITPQAGFIAPHHICPGTCATFTNTSLYTTSYQWSFPGAVPNTSTDVNPTNICYNSPGSYDVTLIASNSTGSDTVTLPNYVIVYPYPSPQGISQSGDTLFAIPGANAYQWYYNGTAITGATDYFYVGTSSGDYNVVATDANGCEVEAVIFGVLLGINNSAACNYTLTINPNPVAQELEIRNFEIQNEPARICIYNMIGARMMELPVANRHGRTASVDVSNLTPGLYMIEIAAGQITARTKFVKQ